MNNFGYLRKGVKTYHISANKMPVFYLLKHFFRLCTMVIMAIFSSKNAIFFYDVLPKITITHTECVFWRSNQERHSICADMVYLKKVLPDIGITYAKKRCDNILFGQKSLEVQN